jgi:hypothetical protein
MGERNLPEADRQTLPGPSRRPVDGMFTGSDPYSTISNPDAYSNWSPTVSTTNIPARNVWEAEQRARSEAADNNYGFNRTPGTTPGEFDLPTTTNNKNNNNNNYNYSTSAQAQADREREALWRQEDRDRDRTWREEDRVLAERLRAEQEARDKANRIQRTAAYDAYDTQMRDVYSADRVNARFDPMVTATGGAYDAGIQRLGGITDAMTARGVQARGDVANAFSAGDQRLQALRQQYQTQAGTMDSGFNDILRGYGAGNVEQGSGYMDRMFANAQTGNARAGTIYDASYADRGALVGGLQGDVEGGMTKDRAGLLARIAGQRATAQQTSDSALAQALAQSGIARGNL